MEKNLQRSIEDVVALMSGLSLILVGQYLGLELGLLAFLIGCVLTVVPAIDIYMMVSDFSFFRKVREDHKGVAWVWAVSLLAILFMPVVYWAIGWPYDMVVNYVLSLYTFTGFMASALIAVRTIISYLLAFGLIFTVVWAIINSKAPTGYGG